MTNKRQATASICTCAIAALYLAACGATEEEGAEWNYDDDELEADGGIAGEDTMEADVAIPSAAARDFDPDIEARSSINEIDLLTTTTVPIKKCSATQATQIRTAYAAAKMAAAHSDSYLFWTTPRKTDRWAKYFGEYSLERWNTVKKHFRNITSAFGRRAAVVRCDCSPDLRVDGWVRPNDLDHNIYVCSGFWKLPDTGKNSKATLLIHEMSHFWDVAHAVDGQSNEPMSAYRLAWFATNK